ncbi:MAG TPA: response regulator, partial [Candidatus Polarisedimenticolia bacterium]|nr:response regulator [Candidatus Polarisedimenticolia bacterium]
MRTYNVLIIDDDPNIRKLLNETLRSHTNYRVLIAGDGREAVRCFVEEKVDIVLTDIHMPGFTGLELMADMKKVKFKPEILVMTANATPENVETARKLGARSVLLKPFDNLDVVEAEIEKAIRAVEAGAGDNGNGDRHAAAAPAAPATPAAQRAAKPPSPSATRSPAPARAPVPVAAAPEEEPKPIE